jgi:hypothetical protein
MSLTYYLDDKDSELNQFFEATFPNRGDLLTRYRLGGLPLRIAPPVGVNAGSVGTAFDYLIRFELVPNPNLYLAMLGAHHAGERFVALLTELAGRLNCTVTETTIPPTASVTLGPVPQRRSELVARGCYLAALLTEVYRSGAVWPGSLLSQVTKRTSLESLLAMVPQLAVDDLQTMLTQAKDVLLPVVAARCGSRV